MIIPAYFELSVTGSNLSKANEKRNFRIFRDFAYHMIELARKKRRRKFSDSRDDYSGVL